jgi:NAD dependent epimerase/dehydratase
MKLLITGAAGFIGSHLAESALQRGYDVRAFIRYKSNGDWGWLEAIDRRNDIEVFAGDIRDFDSVAKAVKGCDAVLHLAALIGIPYSYVSPLAYVKTNIEGTYNVLEAARGADLQNVLITSTSETYGTAQYVPIDEKHPLNAQSPYAATKIAADQLALSYHRSFGVPVKIVRPFNTYGPRQSARAVIPAIISQLLDGNHSIRLGNLSPTRDFTYVKDTVDGFLEILNSDGLAGTVTNIGMNEEISVGDLARLIAELTGRPAAFEHDGGRTRTQSSEVERLRCDNSRLLEHTGWKPQHTLREGLRETISWLGEHTRLYKSDRYNV